jgi:hypothetical protein
LYTGNSWHAEAYVLVPITSPGDICNQLAYLFCGLLHDILSMPDYTAPTGIMSD